MTGVLLLGFVIGMRHAFEADHLAAVSALVSRQRNVAAMARHGALWGIGHTVSLFVLSAVVLLTPWSLPPRFGDILEAIVGLVLIVLGAQLLYQLWRDRVHIHAHRHQGGEVHLHAHSHRGEAVPHAESDHHHRHARSVKTLAVGLTHGAAGSAALTVYVAASLESVWLALGYVLLFGIGSIAGMALLSTVIALPLTASAARLNWAHRALQVSAGIASIGVGVWFVVIGAGAATF